MVRGQYVIKMYGLHSLTKHVSCTMQEDSYNRDNYDINNQKHFQKGHTCEEIPRIRLVSLYMGQDGTISTSIKPNNSSTWHLNGPRHLFLSFCCTTQHIFGPLQVYEPGFNMDKYGSLITTYYNHIIKSVFSP